MEYQDLKVSDLNGELWKDILGYESMYEVSNLGRIKSHVKKKIKILKQYYGGGGQLLVTLSADGNKNKQYVSNVVGCCFIGFPDRKNNEVFCHLNKIKTDNRVVNLAIETRSNSCLLNYHIGVSKDWGIKDFGAKTRFISKYRYVGTSIKNGDIVEYSHNELLNKYASGIRSILRCIEGKKSFKAAYGRTWTTRLI